MPAEMHAPIRQYLASLDWTDDDNPPPAVDFHLYFAGNTEEESIAPNQWGEGRPSIAALYERFKAIAARPDVEMILVGLHYDWNDVLFENGFPPAENIHIYTSADQARVELWIRDLHSDGAGEGWPYGKPRNAPEPKVGNKVYSIFWD